MLCKTIRTPSKDELIMRWFKKYVKRGDFDRILCQTEAADGGGRERKYTLFHAECGTMCKLKKKNTERIIHEKPRLSFGGVCRRGYGSF